MSAIVGLKSGKEFVVENNAYIMYRREVATHVFTLEGEDRLLTVEHGDIEFFIEPKTQNRTDLLESLANRETPQEEVGVDYA